MRIMAGNESSALVKSMLVPAQGAVNVRGLGRRVWWMDAFVAWVWEWLQTSTAGRIGVAASIAGIVFYVLEKTVGVTSRFLGWVRRRGNPAPVTPIPVILHQPPLPQPLDPARYVGLPPAVQVFGRDADVADLRAKLLAQADHKVALVNSGAVLAGQGGIGKTTLARYYITTHAADYDCVLWLLAATRQNVIDGICGGASLVGLAAPKQPQIRHAQEIASKIAASGKRWLLVYDNVENRDDLAGLEPHGAHVLVTTRQGAGWPGWVRVQTDVLDYATPDGAAVQLLMEHAGRSDAPDDARALAQDLGGLPLALMVMGAYLRDQDLGFAIGRAHLAAVLKIKPENAQYPDSVLGAVRLSYDKLTPDAQAVAQVLAFWAADGLGPWLFLNAPAGQFWEAGLDMIPDDLRALVADESRVRAAFSELAGRSLMTGTGDARAMHRLTAAALRDIGGAALAPVATALLAAVYPYQPGHSGNYPICARLTPHVLALLDSGTAPGVQAWEYLLNQTGVYLNAIADYAGYLPLAQENLRVKQARGLPESDREMAVAHASLGVAWQRVGKWEQAEASLTTALTLDEQHRPGTADHAAYLDLLGGLMVAMVRAGQRGHLPRAIKLYQQALGIRRRLFGAQSDPVAEALNNLGAARDLQGRGRAAARLQGVSLKIRRAILPPGDARLGFATLNVGAMWVKNGDAAKAEPLLREALEIREAAFAAQPQHPDRRNAAEWLISCLLVRALGGVNRGMREAEAKILCDRYGFDYDEKVIMARQFPDTP
jgi:tetratricopeptide (TPR) repeat protein